MPGEKESRRRKADDPPPSSLQPAPTRRRGGEPLPDVPFSRHPDSYLIAPGAPGVPGSRQPPQDPGYQNRNWAETPYTHHITAPQNQTPRTQQCAPVQQNLRVVGPNIDAPHDNFGPPPLSPYAHERRNTRPPRPDVRYEQVRQTVSNAGGPHGRNWPGWDVIAQSHIGMTGGTAKQWWERGQNRLRETGGWSFDDEWNFMELYDEGGETFEYIAIFFGRSMQRTRDFFDRFIKPNYPEQVAHHRGKQQMRLNREKGTGPR